MDEMIGCVLGERYRIDDRIGEGGMGVVYRAYQSDLERFVAIKLPHKSRAFDRTHLQRFAREAQVLSRLQHPNIAAVLAAGIAPDGRPFLAMELVEGMPLNRALAGADLAHRLRCLPILTGVAAALAHAHEQGVVHRDLKPGNVMTIVAPEGEQAKVLDFGVSKLLDADSEQKATATGCAIGSPLYMSPEQFTGGAVTERSDIYSFGCMLYELLAGQPPFERETVFALLQAHLHETPAPLSFPPEWRLMGEKLEMVAGKAMQKDPPDRFATMGEIRQALQEISNDPSVALGFGVSAGGVKNPRNRHASPRVMAVGAAAVGCVALALAAGISIWQNRVPDESDANNSGTQSTIAYNLYHRGQLDEAESEARAALKNAKTEFEHRSALMILARSLEDSPHHERRAQAIPMFEELLSYARKANKRTREDIEVMQRCYISTAELALESNAPQAEELARRAYYDARDLYGPEDWRRPRLMAEWARRRGDLQSTLRFDKEMLEALDRHSPPEDETPELAALAARDFLRSGAKPRRIKADILKLLPGPQQFDPNGPKLNKALNEALGLDKP